MPCLYFIVSETSRIFTSIVGDMEELLVGIIAIIRFQAHFT